MNLKTLVDRLLEADGKPTQQPVDQQLLTGIVNILRHSAGCDAFSLDFDRNGRFIHHRGKDLMVHHNGDMIELRDPGTGAVVFTYKLQVQFVG